MANRKQKRTAKSNKAKRESFHSIEQPTRLGIVESNTYKTLEPVESKNRTANNSKIS